MWLLPAFSAISRICVRTFYRVQVDGPPPPADGPLLLLANHPNSLLDPAFVVAFADRPVRFLAKAPLFDQKDIGWLIRGAGAIPVHRAQDDPDKLQENVHTFAAAEAALAEGGAIGIFPEGITHDEPHLSPLKTGAARIALGTAIRTGSAFPIVPIGLAFPEKSIFRSAALVIRGKPVPWDDLASRGPDDVDAVRALTQRMENHLRSVTINLEGWEDREVVEGAEAIYAAEFPVDPAPASRVERLRIATDRLARLRVEGSPVHAELSDGVRRHMTRLGRFGITPADLVRAGSRNGAPVAKIGALGFFGLGTHLLGRIASIVFYPPYRLTGWAHSLLKPTLSGIATHKLIAGILLFLAWYGLLIGIAAWIGGPPAALLVAIGLPLLGAALLWMEDRSNEALREARKGLMVRRRRPAIRAMRQRQLALAEKLDRMAR